MKFIYPVDLFNNSELLTKKTDDSISICTDFGCLVNICGPKRSMESVLTDGDNTNNCVESLSRQIKDKYAKETVCTNVHTRFPSAMQ